jgi:hypothetical protein
MGAGTTLAYHGGAELDRRFPEVSPGTRAVSSTTAAHDVKSAGIFEQINGLEMMLNSASDGANLDAGGSHANHDCFGRQSHQNRAGIHRLGGEERPHARGAQGID